MKLTLFFCTEIARNPLKTNAKSVDRGFFGTVLERLENEPLQDHFGSIPN